MTLATRASTEDGTVRPSALAVFRLITILRVLLDSDATPREAIDRLVEAAQEKERTASFYNKNLANALGIPHIDPPK
jgi:hypothetical protein